MLIERFLAVHLLLPMSFFFGKSQKSMEYTTEHFWPRDLWPMTLTCQLDLDILPLDIHAKIQVCLSVCSAVRVRQTDTHTMPKNITTDMSETVIILRLWYLVKYMLRWHTQEFKLECLKVRMSTGLGVLHNYTYEIKYIIMSCRLPARRGLQRTARAATRGCSYIT